MKSTAWPLVKLSECSDIVSGATPSSTDPTNWDGNIPWITPKELSNLDDPVVTITERCLTPKGFNGCSTRMLPVGTVLFSSRAPIGHVAIAGVEMCTNQGFKSVVPGANLDSRYLYHCLKHQKPQIEARGRGATFKEINGEIMGSVEIPLPPLPEQRRIADILDRADALKRKRQQALQLADDFLRATFLDMFGDPETNPKRLPTARLGDMAAVATGGTPSRNNEANYGGSIPWVKTTEVDGVRVMSTEETLTEQGLASSNCKVFPEDSILIAMYGQGKTRGQVGILGIPATTNQACAVVLPSDKLSSAFLFQHLRLDYRRLRDLGRGGNQPNLNLSLVRNHRVLVPSQVQQEKFARLAAEVARMKERLESATEETGRLTNTLSQRLLTGREVTH